MATARFSMRWWWLGCALIALPLAAQEGAERPSQEDRTAQAEKASPAPAPDKRAPAPAASSTREFRPSEEVSPDQEVDFPADL